MIFSWVSLCDLFVGGPFVFFRCRGPVGSLWILCPVFICTVFWECISVPVFVHSIFYLYYIVCPDSTHGSGVRVVSFCACFGRFIFLDFIGSVTQISVVD